MDVILYVADALRADHLSCYGYDRETTPNVDSLAADGTRYERCFAPATWTRPVAASLVTGWYPPAHGTEGRADTLPEEVPVLAEQFRRAGFATALVTGMGNVSAATGFDRGFDECLEVYKHPEVIDERQTTTAEREELHYDSQDLLAYPRAEDLHGELFAWLDDHSGEDAFALVWAIDPHMPYDPPEGADWYLDPAYDGDPDLGRAPDTLEDASSEADFDRLESLYDCCVRYLDEQVGALIEFLEDRDRFEDSVVAFVGDHGESFGERTLIRNPIRGHSTAPYEEQIHVPFVLRGPDVDAAVRTDLVSLIDVPATVLDVAGVDPSGIRAQGRSLVAEPDGRDAVFSRTNVTAESEVYHGVRTADSKYISITPPPVRLRTLQRNLRRFVGIRLLAETTQLFDLDEDPAERRNLAADARSRCRAHEDDLADWLASCEGVDLGEPGDLTDPATVEQLEALGYK